MYYSVLGYSYNGELLLEFVRQTFPHIVQRVNVALPRVRTSVGIKAAGVP